MRQLTIGAVQRGSATRKLVLAAALALEMAATRGAGTEKCDESVGAGASEVLSAWTVLEYTVLMALAR